MKELKVGVLGVRRGRTMIDYCKSDKRVKLTAICDKWKEGLDRTRKELGDGEIEYYDDFDVFLRESDTDAVVLANYATEHAPFAVKCLACGKHVYSEVLPVQTLAQAVELTEAVEKSGLIYAYAENYCYMAAPREMRRLYREGSLGKFEYGEGEYLHNCETGWGDVTYGNPDHWRNTMSAFYYCTHSVGPLIHICGLKPVKVTGFELPHNDRMARMGAKAGWSGLIVITLENGAVLKCINGVGPSKSSVWFSVYGSRGCAESGREAVEGSGAFDKIYTNLDLFEGENVDRRIAYKPVDAISLRGELLGHGGSDYYAMYNFVSKALGDKDADTIDVCEALDMFLPGVMAYRSVLSGGVPMDIPDLRLRSVRDKYRNDTACTDPETAGDMLQPSYSKGNPEVPDEVYERIRNKLL